MVGGGSNAVGSGVGGVEIVHLLHFVRMGILGIFPISGVITRLGALEVSQDFV